MLKIISVLMILINAQMALSQDKDLIQKLHEKYQDVSHYQAKFVQEKNVSFISKTLMTDGQLEFALDLGLIWQIEKPLWVKTLITDEGVFKTTKHQPKQKVKDLQIKLIAEIMTELLTANLDKIESHFVVSPINSDEIKNETWQINLTPKKLMLKKALKLISLIGQKKGHEVENKEINGISEIVITDKSDNTTRIILSDIKLNKGPINQDIRMKFES